MRDSAQARLLVAALFLSFLHDSQSSPAPYGNTSHLVASFKECLATASIDVDASFFEYEANSESKYTQLNYQWQTLPPQYKPAAYFLPNNAQDIQAAVRCGKPLAVPLVAKGGGHSYEKFSFTPSLTGPTNAVVLDLQFLDQIQVRDNGGQPTVTVGAGALLGQLAWPLYDTYNLITPHGSCPTVGIAGLALGGGYGYFSRMYGLTTDQIVELEMVDSNGELLVANRDSFPELLWALKGAGSGSYGIVTNFTLKAYPTPALVVFGTVRYPLSEFQPVFAAWQLFLASNPPREIQSKLSVGFGNVNVEIHEVQVEEGQADAGRARIATYFATFPTTDSLTFDQQDYPGLMMKTMLPDEYGVTHPSQFPSLTRNSHGARPFKAKSFTVNEVADESQIAALHLALDTLPSDLPWWHMTLIDFYQFGGAITDHDNVDGSSFPHRNQTLYMVQAYYQMVPILGAVGSPRETEQSLAALRQFYSVATEVLHSLGSYSNYADVDLPDYLQRYYGDNLQRLVDVKRVVDPQNYFRHPQSIPLLLLPGNGID